MKMFAPHIVDFYKPGHAAMYPKDTTLVYSNFTCRSDGWAAMLPDFDHKVVNFGLQGLIQWLIIDLWNDTFFEEPKAEVIARYKRRMDNSLGVDAISMKQMEDLHDLGYMPLLIKALPEGARVDLRVPLFTIKNTLPEFYWLTNYVETQLSAGLWHSITTATTAHEYRRLLNNFAEETGASKEFVPFQGHDFSLRGMDIYGGAQSGAAHLISFNGTDTVSAIDYLEDYYSAGNEFVGGSVPATEHSVMCMGGEGGEFETYKRLITEVHPKGIVSIVSDTWDFWEVMTEFTVALKPEIMARDGKVVFRPDSGDPVKIICGDDSAPEGTPAYKGAVQCLWDVFGGTETSKGFKTLDSHVGLIYGDSITLDRARRILQLLWVKGFASDNIVFGIGSYTYQHVTRDTFGTAMKATAGEVDGVFRELFKSPKTDNGVKKSACGLLRVEYDKFFDTYTLHDHQTWDQEAEGELKPVFCNGQALNIQTLATIRQRLNG